MEYGWRKPLPSRLTQASSTTQVLLKYTHSMTRRITINFVRRLLLIIATVATTLSASAQYTDSIRAAHNDSVRIVYPDGSKVVLAPSTRRSRPAPSPMAPISETDSMDASIENALSKDKKTSGKDVLRPETQSSSLAKIKEKAARRDWSTWRPDPKRALWLALVIPGGGQIYNRKYWKLPIFYGGFVGCIYAITWNNQMYHDYAQAYMDIMDNNPDTKSYEQFMHFGNQITDENRTRYQELFRKRKNRYRRWRDLASFVTIAVYAVSVIDAYVDASLSDFDISRDLSLHIAPRVLNNGQSNNPLQSSAIGIGAALKF